MYTLVMQIKFKEIFWQLFWHSCRRIFRPVSPFEKSNFSRMIDEWRLNILFVLKSGQGSQLSVIHVLYYSLFFFFQSVLHYNNHAFSKDYHDTIESKKNPNRRFGQRESFSRHDIKQINQLYGCDVENLNNLLQDVPFN